MCSVGAVSSAVAAAVLEFQFNDNAWYSVTVSLDDDVLRVRYCDFAREHDDLFNANDFRCLSELCDFESRFRLLSRQFQDYECPNMNPGMAVCASYSSRADDVRFYDAVVEGVDYLEHSFENGEEECLCNFILCWQNGPKSGNLTTASIANVCQIQFCEVNDTVLATFSRIVREKIQTRMNRDDTCSVKDNRSPTLKRKPSFFQLMKQDAQRAKRFSGTVEPCEDIQTLSPRYNDTGRMKYQYMILLENLDKGLSPVELAKFLHEQTWILPRVYIFPGLTFELYARGVVVLNCRGNLEGLCAFLDDPNHVIVSSQGRPLVVTGKVARRETFGTVVDGAMVQDCETKIWDENDDSVRCELKVVKVGTKEYLDAKHMKDLFMEFHSHQRRLHKSLAMEENKTLLCSGGAL